MATASLIVALVVLIYLLAVGLRSRTHSSTEIEGLPELRQAPRSLPQELKDWVREDFSAEFQEIAMKLMADSRLGDRELRCALFLGEGDLDKLKRAIDLGKLDYRDLILNAEYETPGYRRVRDFTEPRR